jgi:omega-3 fatty acid desaturase (delta-15 desaturase)
VRAEGASPLPFGRRELLAALPRNARTPSTARSLACLGGDVALLGALYTLSLHLQSPFWSPLLWFLQGTMFWALFVIGHDCGHGSFSRLPWLNALVGHLTHTPLLVPFHPWRLSHRAHHRHTADLERDEAWAPLTHEELHELSRPARFLRLRVPLLVFPFYLLRGTPRRGGSHFNPFAPFVPPGERAHAWVSVLACGVFAGVLLGLGLAAGPLTLLRLYAAPWAVFVCWVDLVTLLHHTDPRLPWYRGAAWSPLRGALSTVDRGYGLFERIHHDAGCHLAHHLFPSIPHYRLRAATAALRPVLGPWYREDRRPIWQALRRARRDCALAPAMGGQVLPGPVPARLGRDGRGAGSRPATR